MAEPFEPLVIWDLEDDPDGNYVRIVIEHGISQEEVWDVVSNPKNLTVPSDSSGRPSTFGWTKPEGTSWWSGNTLKTIRGPSSL